RRPGPALGPLYAPAMRKPARDADVGYSPLAPTEASRAVGGWVRLGGRARQLGEGDREPGLARPAGDGDGPVVRGGDRVHDGQAEPGAGRASGGVRAGAVAADEPLEQRGQQA